MPSKQFSLLRSKRRLPPLWLPPVEGRTLRVEFRPSLSEWRGRLFSGKESGVPIHAAAYLRRRLIVLEAELLATPRTLRRILAHEVFHFAWVRLGNQRRLLWEMQLRDEMRRGVRGELGWSAEMRKLAMEPRDWRRRTRRWRDYLCESFCDSAARCYIGAYRDDEYTLARRHAQARFRLLESLFSHKLAL